MNFDDGFVIKYRYILPCCQRLNCALIIKYIILNITPYMDVNMQSNAIFKVVKATH